jgi:AcrR family transcriptional regulator
MSSMALSEEQIEVARERSGAPGRSARPPAPRRRARMARPQREGQMLAVARALFGERGFAAVTMEEVATAAGITKPLLYNYFGNKEQLYLACMDPAADALLEAILTAVSSAGDPAEALVVGIGAFFAFLERERGAWRVLFDETLPASGEVAQRVSEYRERLAALLEDVIIAQLGGAVAGRAAIEVRALSAAVLGAAEALGRWWLRQESITAAQAAEMLAQTLLPGMRARISGRRSEGAGR